MIGPDDSEWLRLALAAGRMGTWNWTIRTNRVDWSAGLEAIHGLATGTFPGTFEAYLSDVHPEDRDRVIGAITRTLEQGEDHLIEYRLRWPNGNVRWVEARGRLFRDENAQPVRMTGVCIDITERQRLQEALRQRMDDLAESDRRKDEFLALLSHELRNPLAPIRNALQIIRQGDAPDPASKEAHRILDRQVEHLSRLVDDLLDVSRITLRKVELRKTRVDLSTVALHAVDTARPLFEERRQHLSVTLDPTPLWLDADAVRLEQITSNLLNNAAKYTDPGGRIDLRTQRDGDHALLRVADNGMGIAPDMLQRIFDLFSQADRSLDRSQGGLGIGLTLVRSLVQMHGGAVTATSEGLGRGSEFCIRLPLAPALAASVAQPTVRAAAPPVDAGRVASGSLGVVVVDDNKDGADSLALLLELWDYRVGVVYDGPTALQVIEARRPDVVLLDIGLPGMDGYQVAQRLRHSLDFRPVVIALTGYGQDEDRRRSREAGFDHHLTKPIDPAALRQLLSTCRPSHPEADVRAIAGLLPSR